MSDNFELSLVSTYLSNISIELSNIDRTLNIIANELRYANRNANKNEFVKTDEAEANTD